MRCTKKTLNFLLHWNFTAHTRDESAHAHNVKCCSKNQPSLLFAGCLPLNFTSLSRLEPLPGLLVADSVSVTMDNQMCYLCDQTACVNCLDCGSGRDQFCVDCDGFFHR